MGGAEGNEWVPPIVASRLHAPGRPPAGHRPRVASSLARLDLAAQSRPALTEGDLARLLATGLRPDGRALSPLMPRYDLDAPALAALRAHLRDLDRQFDATPPKELHLATVVTDTAAAPAREQVTRLLQDCLRPGEVLTPTWRLHVWTVGGPASSWEQQLQDLQARQPVFALVSGLSPDAWTPVQRWCEQQHLPCVLPVTGSVDPALPSDWSLHFSRGVALEASLVEEDLRHRPDQQTVDVDGSPTLPPAPVARPPRLLQLLDHSEAAQIGARVLQERLAGTPWRSEQALVLPDNSLDKLQRRWLELQPGDALVLWLDAAALSRLERLPPPAAGVTVYLSAERAGPEKLQLPAAWTAHLRVPYGYEAPERRVLRQLGNLGPWRSRLIGSDPELIRLAGHSLAACEMTGRALRQMGRNPSRLWFMELLEAGEEAAVATAFPRFTLGPGQRVGSRGGLMLSLQPGSSTAPPLLQPLGDWRLPDWSDVEPARPRLADPH